MPRPPPPAAALRMTGKPICSAWASASSASFRKPRAPGRSGRPAFSAASRAATLFPMSRIISGRGPMNFSPMFWTISANPAFSERNP